MITELLSEGGLSLDRLQNFCRVAEAGGVTRAAKGDATKQSLYSRQIKELEEFFGAELMRRKGRGISLTSAGQHLHRMTREQFASLNDFRFECRGQPMEIVFGAGESLIQWLLLPDLHLIEKRLPSARHKFLNLTNAEIIQRLIDGLIDFGIVRKAEVPRQLGRQVLGSMTFSLFLPEHMHKRTQGKLFENYIAVLPLAILEGEGSFRQDLAGIARKRKLRLDVKMECSSFPLVARAVANGNVAGILPNIARKELCQPSVIEISSNALKTFSRELCLVWSPRRLRVRPGLEKARQVYAELLSLQKS